MVNEQDISFLKQAVSLAREALDAGDAPFGSVLVVNGQVIRGDRNRTNTGESGDSSKPDATLHPEFTLARWAQFNLTPAERVASTVYTSGEHCPMCSSAHAYAGLGRIVYAGSGAQLQAWMVEFARNIGQKPGAQTVAALPIEQVAPLLPVEGPVDIFAEELKEMHWQRFERVAAKTKGNSG